MKKQKAFKAFNQDFTCRDFKYEVGKEYETAKPINPCSHGFHACKKPLDVLTYYPEIFKNKYAEVEQYGDLKEEDNKTVSSKIKIIAEISLKKLFNSHFKMIIDICKKSSEKNTSGYGAHSNTSGDGAHSNTSGDRAHSNTSGDEAHSNTSGDEAHSNTSGDGAHSNTSGDRAHSNTSGDEAHSNTSGDEAHSNTSGDGAHSNTSGDEAHSNTSGYGAHSNTSGDESIASSLGIKGVASASKGWIVLVDWRYINNEWVINNIYRAKVGKHKIQGTLIKPKTKYWFDNGELKYEKIK